MTEPTLSDIAMMLDKLDDRLITLERIVNDMNSGLAAFKEMTDMVVPMLPIVEEMLAPILGGAVTGRNSDPSTNPMLALLASGTTG